MNIWGEWGITMSKASSKNSRLSKSEMNSNPWETGAEWLRKQPELKQLVIDCYMDEDVTVAAERFSKGEEFAEVQKWAVRFGLPKGGRVLDIGAGNGISSYAWAIQGYAVMALESNDGNTTGTRAIRRLSKQTGVDIEICLGYGEHIGLKEGSFDLVYCRALLHHTADLNQICREAFRVLRSGGTIIATREHVVDGPEQLAQFLQQHPTHWLTGTEMAYSLPEYQRALVQAGFKILRTYGPIDTVVNYYPKSINEQALRSAQVQLGCVVGSLVGSTALWQAFWKARSRRAGSPGRLCSFVAVKPPPGINSRKNKISFQKMWIRIHSIGGLYWK